MTTATTEYISCADTAKLIRLQLKSQFPGVKFSVKSKTYSMGASIRIHWTDGPTIKVVDGVTGPFEGKGFDGMIDMAYSKEAWLMPDGSVSWGYSAGTGASRGSDPGYAYAPPSADARPIHFGADYIFTERTFSLPVYTAAVEHCAKYYGVAVPLITVQEGGYTPYVKYEDRHEQDDNLRERHFTEDFQMLVHRYLQDLTF